MTKYGSQRLVVSDQHKLSPIEWNLADPNTNDKLSYLRIVPSTREYRVLEAKAIECSVPSGIT